LSPCVSCFLGRFSHVCSIRLLWRVTPQKTKAESCGSPQLWPEIFPVGAIGRNVHPLIFRRLSKHIIFLPYNMVTIRDRSQCPLREASRAGFRARESFFREAVLVATLNHWFAALSMDHRSVTEDRLPAIGNVTFDRHIRNSRRRLRQKSPVSASTR
jgi:hypothetical protein